MGRNDASRNAGKPRITVEKFVSAAGRSTVYGLFHAQVRRKPSAVAVEFKGATTSFADLDIRVRKLANLLIKQDVRRGDRVAILSENRPEYIEAELACAMTGAILACQNWRLTGRELQYCISLVAPKILLVSADKINAIRDLSLPDCRVINFDTDYPSLIGTANPANANPDVDPEDGMLILYTSGTTGLPKGALISQRAQIARMCALRMDVGIRDQDAFIAWAPMFHMASTDQLLGALMSGSPVAVIDGFQPDAIIDAAERHSLGWFVMMPGVIEPFIRRLKERKPRLNRIACVGAMADLVPRQEIVDLTALLNAPYFNSFGSTETGTPPASAALIQPWDTQYSLSKRISSVCEVRLVDDHGAEVPEGAPGELAIRGPTVFSGYWNAPETNAKDFRDGWFHMGDLFRRNPDGTLDFVDRAKYLIKSGGENIYPAEIERVLLADTRIADAAVVRKKDAQWGEVPVAFIARNDADLSVADVNDLCRANLANYKRPKEIHFIPLDDLPRSTTGKIQRHELEARLENTDMRTASAPAKPHSDPNGGND